MNSLLFEYNLFTKYKRTIMEQQSKVIILVATHKLDGVYKDKVYMPIQVGKALSDLDLGFQGDDTGDNISEKNSMFCELTAHYWAWKNLKDVDYIGLCHYRRYFDLKVTEENIKDLMSDCDLIIPTAIHHSATLYNAKLKTMSGEDVAIFFKVMKEKFPKYYCTAVNYIMNNNKDYAYNMLICSRGCYEDLMNFVFSFLFECEKYVMLSPYTNSKRIFGFFSEYLIPIYFFAHKLRIKETPLISMLSAGQMHYIQGRESCLRQFISFLRMKVANPHKKCKYEIPQSVLNGLFRDGILDANFQLSER